MNQKKTHDEVFKDAFAGVRHDRDKFMAKVLDERARNIADLKPYAELAGCAETVFGERPTEETPVPTVDLSALLAHETAPILKKPVIGKTDVDIAAMIKKLCNSDWVRQGRAFYDANNGTCPFCQQETPRSFADSLEAYFDETYAEEKQATDDLVSSYFADAQAVQQRIDNIVSEPGKFVDVENLQAQKALLDETLRANGLELRHKQDAPSQAADIESLADTAAAIKEVIDAANTKIREHNQTVRNFDVEQRQLKTQVWRYVLDELHTELTWYDDTKANLDKAIGNISKRIDDADEQVAAKTAEIRDLEKQTTSVRPTVDYINDILKKFGFNSFSLAIGDDGRSYKLVRPTGEDAGKTLSEGEKSFVVFLYFYHWLRGSTSENGMTADRAVVFDDPVSSLDSDILFIVSTLIREVCEEARENRGRIKQVFVFTHNVYFHREVTYRQHGSNIKKKDQSFWIVRKRAAGSAIEVHDKNPIKTSYELLWSEVRKPDPEMPGLENTLRRILEYYFKVIGGTPLDKL